MPSVCVPGQTGRLEFILWPQDENNLYILRLRYENGRYLGNTYFGEPILNFVASGTSTLGQARYSEWSGGSGPTNLSCTNAGCTGVIDGTHSHFTTVVKPNGDEVLDGVLNFYRITMKKNKKNFSISTSGAGSLQMQRQKNGDFEGRAYYFTSDRIREFDARLIGEGCMKDFKDDPLLMIILGAPLAVQDDRAGGVRETLP